MLYIIACLMYNLFNIDIAECSFKKENTLYEIPSYYKGNKRLDYSLVFNNIKYIIEYTNNVKVSNDSINLIIETLIVESDLGGMDYKYSAKHYHNYGIAQFRLDTAKELLKVLKKRNIVIYKRIKSLMFKGYSLKYNLLYNAKFSIALTYNYYIYRFGNRKINISTIRSRARVWKQYYNTYRGVGTINGYIRKVSNFR